MRRHHRAGLILLAGLALAEPGPLAAGGGPVPAHDCAEELLERAWPGLEGGLDLAARVRVTLDACDRDVLVALTRRGEAVEARARLVRPARHRHRGAPLPDTATISRPDASCDRVIEVRFADSPELRERLGRRLSQLEALAISPVLEPVLWVHAVRYDIAINSDLSHSRFRFLGPGYPRHEGDELHPLDAWAQALLRDLGLVCSAS